MNTFKLIVLALLALPSASFAVSVAQCPQTLKIELSHLDRQKGVEDIENDIGWELEPEEEQAVNASFYNIAQADVIVREFALGTAKNGKCQYFGQDDEKIEIYSAKGKDLVYMQTVIGPRGILLRTYSSIKSLNAGQLELTGDAGMALALPRFPYESYDAGGTLTFIGKAFAVVK